MAISGILDALAKNKAVDFGGFIPGIAYTHIDDTYEKCYGYTQGMKENTGYSVKGRNDAARPQKAGQKELMEEYMEKRARMKGFQQEVLDEKITKQELERSRLAKAWSSRRQMAKASAAYDANVLRKVAGKFEYNSDDSNVRELTIQNTNEAAWEHYMAMRGMSSQTLKDGNYKVDDVMKSIIDTYATRYHEIAGEHERGDREVSYGLTGKSSLTLDEDLAGLDEAFKMQLANLEGYITCQQTNRAFENPDSSWYFKRSSLRNERKTKDGDALFFTEFKELAVSIMEEAREKTVTTFKNDGYKEGAAVSILSELLNENASFFENFTQNTYRPQGNSKYF